jgi:hypothetical protein
LGLSRRAILLTLGIELLVSCLHAQERRGAFALHYAPTLTAAELDWYSRFDVLITHDCLPLEQVRRLHEKGTRLFFYEWSVAFYVTRADDWERSLIETRSPVLLNEDGLRGGVGSMETAAFYFDPVDKGGRTMRAELLEQRLRTCRYDGIFFDTTRFESVHPLARAEYERRHPDLAYDVAYSDFLRAVRQRLGKRLIFTNQGFQDAANFLPWADWDLSESLVTHPREGHFVPRRWNDEADLWNSSRFILEHLAQPVTERYKRVRSAHLNYIDGADRNAIHLVVAAARLFEGEGYVVAPSVDQERDEIYFWDPGKPLGVRVDANHGEVSYRLFEHGLIVINGGDLPYTIDAPLSAGRRYRNLTTNELLPPGATLVVPGATDGRPVAYLYKRVE